MASARPSSPRRTPRATAARRWSCSPQTSSKFSDRDHPLGVTRAHWGGARRRGLARAHVMHQRWFMAHITHNIEELWHDHPGARWLTPMMVAFAVAVLAILYFVAYPHL